MFDVPSLERENGVPHGMVGYFPAGSGWSSACGPHLAVHHPASPSTTIPPCGYTSKVRVLLQL